MNKIEPEQVRRVIDSVEDPELPVTLTDLGVVRAIDVHEDQVRVLLRPTRLACPARAEMARRVRAAVYAIAPHAQVEVNWELRQWRPGDISADGTRALRRAGVSRPRHPGPLCPYCGSPNARRDGAFGGSVCKTAYSCRACGSTFDTVKGG